MSGTCSVCQTNSETFPKIRYPNDWTVQVINLREECLLPGTNEIDPETLQLCQDCFDIVDDRVEHEMRENRAKKLLRTALTTRPSSTSTATNSTNGEGDKKPELKEERSEDGEEVEEMVEEPRRLSSRRKRTTRGTIDSISNEAGSSTSTSTSTARTTTSAPQGEAGSSTSTSTSQREGNAKRRKQKKITFDNSASTAHSNANQRESGEDSLDDLFEPVTRVQKRKKRREERSVIITLNTTESEDNPTPSTDAPAAQDTPSSSSTGTNQLFRINPSLLAIPTNGNRDQSISTTATPFFQHPYNLPAALASCGLGMETILEYAFQYYNAQILWQSGEQNISPPSTTTWMEKTGILHGFPLPNLLTTAPKKGKGKKMAKGWTQDKLLPSMKLDLGRGHGNSNSLILGFGTTMVYDYLKNSCNKGNLTKVDMLFNIEGNTPIFVTFTTGIVCQLEKPTEAREMENCEFPLIAGLAIPKVDGMTITTFEFTKEINQKYGKGTKVTGENCLEILKISDPQKVRAILVSFTGDYNYAGKGNPVGTLTSALFQFIKRNPEAAIVGGRHQKNLLFKREGSLKRESEPLAVGIVISGEASTVMAASVNLPGPKTEDEAQKVYGKKDPIPLPTEKLQKMRDYFKQDGKPKSFAIQISCCGRGHRMNKALNKEASLFKQFFPNTPLVGGLNIGEFVHEYHPWGKEAEDGGDGEPTYKIPEKEEQLTPWYTTTFLTVFHK